MIKRICSCGKVFETNSFDVKCLSCKKWNDYICSHPRPERRNQPDEFHFAFSETWVQQKARELLNSSCHGYLQVDKKDKNHYAIFIHLYTFDIKNKNVCEQIASCISHELCHLVCYITNNYDLELTKKLDSSGILKKLELEGFL